MFYSFSICNTHIKGQTRLVEASVQILGQFLGSAESEDNPKVAVAVPSRQDFNSEANVPPRRYFSQCVSENC